MDPVALLLAYLIVNTVSSGGVNDAIRGAFQGGRAALAGSSSSGTRMGTGKGGRTASRTGPSRRPSATRTWLGGARVGAAGALTGHAQMDRWRGSRQKWGARTARLRDGWQKRREDPTRHPVEGSTCQWQTSSYHVHPLYKRFCGRPLPAGKDFCDEHEAEWKRDYKDDGTPKSWPDWRGPHGYRLGALVTRPENDPTSLAPPAAPGTSPHPSAPPKGPRVTNASVTSANAAELVKNLEDVVKDLSDLVPTAATYAEISEGLLEGCDSWRPDDDTVKALNDLASIAPDAGRLTAWLENAQVALKAAEDFHKHLEPVRGSGAQGDLEVVAAA